MAAGHHRCMSLFSIIYVWPAALIQDSLASLGAGFGSALADIIHLRIPALFVPLRSALIERPPDVQRPRGAYIRWGLTPATDTDWLLTA